MIMTAGISCVLYCIPCGVGLGGAACYNILIEIHEFLEHLENEWHSRSCLSCVAFN